MGMIDFCEKMVFYVYIEFGEYEVLFNMENIWYFIRYWINILFYYLENDFIDVMVFIGLDIKEKL